MGDDDVLIRVHAAAVCKGDVHLLTGRPYLMRLVFGLRRPRQLVFGQNLAGRVEAVGERVTTLRPGDDVYGEVLSCGSFAEYVAAPADKLAPMPANLTYEQAAAVPYSGITALQGLRDAGKLQAGQTVLINGASGGIGTSAVQIAKAMGAEVTAVCSTRHVELLHALGADDVVDYTREDFSWHGPRHDVMLDLVGNRPLADCRRALKPKGIYVACSGDPRGDWIGPIVWMASLALTNMVASQTIATFLARPRRDDLLALTALIEAGKLRPVIERRYPLGEAAAALRHVTTGHAQGTTVIGIR